MTPENRVSVVTDTSADIPVAIKRKLNIKETKIRTYIGDEEIEGTAELLKAMKNGTVNDTDRKPRTSTPPIGEFIKLYEELSGEILSVHMMKSKSSTYDTACSAAKQVMEAHPEIEIKTFESKVSMGLGFLVMEAARNCDKSSDEIMEIVKNKSDRTLVAFAFDTLKYAYIGGRISRDQYLLGQMLNIKPVFTVTDEDFDVESRQRGRKKSLERLIEIVKKHSPLEEVAIIHAGVREEAEGLADKIKTFYDGIQIIAEVGPVVAAYGGPGVIGICAVKSKTI